MFCNIVHLTNSDDCYEVALSMLKNRDYKALFDYLLSWDCGDYWNSTASTSIGFLDNEITLSEYPNYTLYHNNTCGYIGMEVTLID